MFTDNLQPAALSQDYTAQPLPAPPPSLSATKGPTIWDKQHIGDTLLAIGSGFLSGHNFGDGLAAAGQGILGQQQGLRDRQLKSTTYGGPDGEFAITTDANGNRSVAPVAAFVAANQRKRDDALKLKTAVSAKDRADLHGRVIHAISKLPQEQQAAAYADLKANPTQYGLDDASDLPDAWTPQYGAVGGAMGTPVYQAESLDQRARNAADRRYVSKRKLDQGDIRLRQGQARVDQGAARVAQGQERVDQGAQRLKTPPASVRNAGQGYAQVHSQADYAALPAGTQYQAPDGSIRIKK